MNTPKLIRLINKTGATVCLTDIGAAVVAVTVPDKNGCMADVALGYKNIDDYMNDSPCSGKIVGRYANRIAGAKICIDGKEYILDKNDGENCNHSGRASFANRLWTLTEISENMARFELISPDGDGGFPGKVRVSACYEWHDDNSLCLSLTARTTATTVINLTNHTYWNLSGHNSGSIFDHVLKLESTHYLPSLPDFIPTGEIAPVSGTPMDFTAPKAVGRDIDVPFPDITQGRGYNSCWVIDKYEKGILSLNATLSDPVSGRILRVYSSQPGVQVYTGGWLDDSPVNKAMRRYRNFDGIALECQDFPDAPHHSRFPSTLLHPGETYKRQIVYRFGIEAL